MFGSYDAKVSIFDISVNTLTKDEETQLRCSYMNMSRADEAHCRQLCHDNCIGCYKASSPSSCKKCRYDAIYDENRLICLDTCPRGFEKNTILHLCEDIDECSRNDTLIIYRNRFSNEIYKWSKCAFNYSVCTNKMGSYECKCIDGYEGDGFTCKDINECDPDKETSFKCPISSKCVNYMGTYACVCLNGFQMVNSTCQDIDECKLGTHECQNLILLTKKLFL